MVTFQNQKVVHTRSAVHDETHRYGVLGIDAVGKAAKTLNDPTAFMLYVYMALNKDGFELALSPKAVYAQMGLSVKQYRRAVKLLMGAGYLVPMRSGSNHYDFYELPVQQETTANREFYPPAVSTPEDSTPEDNTPEDNTPEDNTLNAVTANGSEPDIALQGSNLYPWEKAGTTPVEQQDIPVEGAEILQDKQELHELQSNVPIQNESLYSGENQEYSVANELKRTHANPLEKYEGKMVCDEDGNMDYIPALYYVPHHSPKTDADYDLPF